MEGQACHETQADVQRQPRNLFQPETSSGHPGSPSS